MRKLIGLILLILIGCGGSLSKEQREEMREAQKMHEIKRVTEVQLFEKALETGKKIVSVANAHDVKKIDSIAEVSQAKIKWLDARTNNATAIEEQIFEAYLMSVVSGDAADNLQKIGEDSLLYSSPVVNKLPDGAVEIKGMWSIMLAKKDIILSIE